MAGTEDKKSKKEEKSRNESKIRENVESILIAIILALIIRQFAMEAFVIPTGSMAPTLYGQHVEISCPNCGREFAIETPDKSGTQATFERAYKCVAECPRCHKKGVVYLQDNGPYCEYSDALCQACGHSWEVKTPQSGKTVPVLRLDIKCPNCTCCFKKDLTPSDIRGGHKILVNKAGILVRPPKRWDVIVFKFPEKKQGQDRKNYIKRLIGLPNENLLIRNGDIYANGKIARKELDVIHAMSFEVFNSELSQKWEKFIPWESDDNWKLSAERLQVRAHKGESQAEFNKYITSALPYPDPDASDHSSKSDVNDVGYQLTVSCSGEGEFFCSIDNGAHCFRFTLPVGSKGKAKLLMDDNEIKTASVRLKPSKSYDVEFLDVDDRVLALLDGEEIFRFDYDSDPTLANSARILLGTVNTAARIEKIRVYRDIYYTCKGEYAVYDSSGSIIPEESSLPLGPDEYFALGDNSASSSDSRVWGTVPAQNMLGRAFIIFWPIPQVRFIK